MGSATRDQHRPTGSDGIKKLTQIYNFVPHSLLPACLPVLIQQQSGLDEGSVEQVWEVSLHTGQLICECIQYQGLFRICLSNANIIKKGIVLNPPF